MRAWTLGSIGAGASAGAASNAATITKLNASVNPCAWSARVYGARPWQGNGRPMWLLFDDARDGGGATALRAEPRRIIVARAHRRGAGARAGSRRPRRASMPRVIWPMRRAMRSIPSWRPARGRSEGRCLVSACSTFRNARPWGAAAARRRRVRRAPAAHPAIMRRRPRGARHLFAGDFYQANLTFGCDVAVARRSAGALRAAAAIGRRGWGGVIHSTAGPWCRCRPSNSSRSAAG